MRTAEEEMRDVMGALGGVGIEREREKERSRHASEEEEKGGEERGQ